MKHFTVIDNILEEHEFKKIEDLISGPDFPWFFQSSVAVAGQEDLPDYYFTHQIFRKDTNYCSPYIDVLQSLLEKIDVKDLIRIKANLYPNIGAQVVNKSHVDFPFVCKGAILYINTNNGYTVLNDGTRIDSVRNRLLIFDSEKPHSSVTCDDQKVRLNINFNYIGNNNE